jgi:hypothetical protein
MHFLPATGLYSADWGLAAATIATAATAAWWGRGSAPMGLALPALVLVNLLGATQLYGYLAGDGDFFTFRAAFEAVRERLTLQDRVYPYSAPLHYGLQRKSPSVFRLPTIHDYETQTSQRFAELYVRMIHNAPMESINDFYYQVSDLPKNRPLFNLLAARYLLLHSKGPFFWPEQLRDFELRRRVGFAGILENTRALPRAYFVPRVEVIADPAALLERLASSAHDPRAVALVEEPPPGGDLGGEGPRGEVTIVADRSEELVVHVRAGGPGFLFLADQLYPGWQATVNGKAEPVVRANYAFRLVRVPGGESEVVFRYRPLSVRLGLGASLVTLLAVLGFAGARLARKARGWARSEAARSAAGE